MQECAGLVRCAAELARRDGEAVGGWKGRALAPRGHVPASRTVRLSLRTFSENNTLESPYFASKSATASEPRTPAWSPITSFPSLREAEKAQSWHARSANSQLGCGSDVQRVGVALRAPGDPSELPAQEHPLTLSPPPHLSLHPPLPRPNH